MGIGVGVAPGLRFDPERDHADPSGKNHPFIAAAAHAITRSRDHGIIQP